MPQPIILPPKQRRISGAEQLEQSLTQLGQMYAQGLVQQKLQERNQPDDYEVKTYGGENFLVGIKDGNVWGKPIHAPKPTPKDQFSKPYVDPRTNIYVQRNLATNKLFPIRQPAEKDIYGEPYEKNGVTFQKNITSGEVEKIHAPSTPTPKTGQNYLLGDKTIVTSFDGGHTYRNEARKDVPMPVNAVKVGTVMSGSELNLLRSKEQATTDLDKQKPSEMPSDIVSVAEGGTGPWSMLKASIDRVFGGIGVDKIFGADGFFPKTQENRQTLRTIKQVGKAALMNSSRGAIWEQEKIDNLFPDPDKIFVNPTTEAKKFKSIRETLLTEKRFNNEAILTATTPSVVQGLQKSNIDIDRLLALIGTGEEQLSGPQVGVVEDGYTFKGGNPADPKSWEKVK